MRNFYLRVCFLMIIGALFIFPLIQMKYDIFPKPTLSGVEQTVPKPNFKLGDFLNGSFQKSFESWLNKNIGLREYFVKTSNQVFYSVFNETNSLSPVVVGKKGQLLEGSYVYDYLNIIPPIEFQLLEARIAEMKKIQDAMDERGKTFLLLITPSKAAIYPEYIPEKFNRMKIDGPRNYDMLITLLEKYDIHYVDGHSIAVEHKSKYEMFPKGGTHWNYLGAYYTSQRTIEKLQELTGKRLVNLELTEIKNTAPTGTDRDLAELLNVWIPPTKYTTPKPVIVANLEGVNFSPSILMEGGSFSEQFINILNDNLVFKNLDLYFYYHTHIAYNEPGQGGNVIGEVKSLDWEKDVLNHDIIILEMNEQNISKLEKGFIQDGIAYFNPLNISFANINSEYVQNTIVEGMSGYLIKKGAMGSGTVYLESNPMSLVPNQSYTISYKAKGYHALNFDLFPDDLPQYNNLEITQEVKEFSYTFRSESENMRSAVIRFFIDGLDVASDQDTLIYDIKIKSIEN